MAHRGWSAMWGAALVLVCLSACSAVSPDSWSVAPIEFDNSTDGGREDRIDVTYSMSNMTDDTAGGFWTESAGSWLHLDSNGDTLRRFNAESITTIHGISAISPTVLAVSQTGGARTGISLYDTDAETWTRVEVDATTIGDVTAGADGLLVYVDFLGATVPQDLGTSHGPADLRPFAIRTVDQDGRETTVLGPESGAVASAVRIDIDSAGTVYVSTEREAFTIAADGKRLSLSTYPAQEPVLAVNAVGNVLTAASARTDTGERVTEWAILRGSSAARDVLATKGECSTLSETAIAVLTGTESKSLPFSCRTNGAVWLSDTTFVLSIGDEGGTILARVTPPEKHVGR